MPTPTTALVAAALLAALVLTPAPAAASCLPGQTPAPGQWIDCLTHPTPTPLPTTAALGVTVRVPDNLDGDGTFVISVGAATSGSFAMGIPTTEVDGAGHIWLHYQRASIPPIWVTDTRPGLLAYAVTGQVRMYSDPIGVFGRWFGWTPAVLPVADTLAGAVLGPQVMPGYPDGNGYGLSRSRVLATVADGHGGDTSSSTAAFTAALDLRVPGSVPPGSYGCLLTLTLIG